MTTKAGRLSAVFPVLLLALLPAGVFVTRSSHGYKAEVPATTPATPVPTPAAGSAPPVPSRKSRDAELTRSLKGYLAGRDGRLSVSVRDLSTGASYTYGSSRRFPTASVVKAGILAALLLQTQRAGRGLTGTERSLAARMICDSDNDAATALWNAVGGASGLTRANRVLGLTETTAASGGYWGLTMTSARDQVRLLAALALDGPLSARSRAYALDLMGSVSSGQDWGVSAAATPGDPVALKNGWLPRAADGGLWVVNSIGRVRSGGHDHLVAVLSDRSPSMDAGVATVEHVAGLVVRGLS